MAEKNKFEAAVTKEHATQDDEFETGHVEKAAQNVLD